MVFCFSFFREFACQYKLMIVISTVLHVSVHTKLAFFDTATAFIKQNTGAEYLEIAISTI